MKRVLAVLFSCIALTAQAHAATTKYELSTPGVV